MILLARLLRFVRPYGSPLVLSVFLMAIAGGAHAMMAVLIGPIFDRVLDPSAPDAPVKLFSLPGGQPVFLALAGAFRGARVPRFPALAAAVREAAHR